MYLTPKELSLVGFKFIGKDVLISNKCSIYNPGKISIMSHTRIDDFTILSAGEGIFIGGNVHIAPFTSLRGQGKITIGDLVRLSSNVQVISSTDDFTGEVLPGDNLEIMSDNIVIERKAVIGSGSVILPGVIIGENSSIGALSLVKRSIPANEVWAGSPVKHIKTRKIKKAL